MRAVEVSIVLEDDDGNIRVARYIDEAKIAMLLTDDVARAEPDFPIAPVLRRVTLIEGAVEHDGDAHCINGGSLNYVYFRDLLPEGTESEKRPLPKFAFRFTVEAVRIPDPACDARELSGLPGRKP